MCKHGNNVPCSLCRDEKELYEILNSILQRQPNTRFWKNKVTGIEYHYTTEQINGGFYALVYKPVGTGARSGKVRRWRLIDKHGPYGRREARNLAKSLYLESRGEK